MSYRDVLKVFKLERELSDDDTAMLNTLRQMTPSDRELTVEAFGGSMGKGSSKSSSTKQRKIEHCEVCNYTRRAAVHKDSSLSDYHGFVSPSLSSAKKSARASSLASAIKGTARGRTDESDDDNRFDGKSAQDARKDFLANPKPLLCDFSIDGKVCGGEESDGIHDKSLGYGNYHEFQPPVVVAASGD